MWLYWTSKFLRMSALYTICQCMSCAATTTPMCLPLHSGANGDPEAAPPQVEILERVDVAQLAGLMPDHPNAVPAWFAKELQEELIDTMVRPCPGALWWLNGAAADQRFSYNCQCSRIIVHACRSAQDLRTQPCMCTELCSNKPWISGNGQAACGARARCPALQTLKSCWSRPSWRRPALQPSPPKCRQRTCRSGAS
jgi:hypothetical protein